MFNAVIFASIIGLFAFVLSALFAVSEWAHKEGRVPCVVLWYKKWSLKEGKRKAARIKLETRVARRAA